MVRKLVENDREKTIKFLVDEAAINLFIIGDIENYGFHSEFMEIWGSFNDENCIEGILLRYHESYICYCIDGFKERKEFKEIISNNEIYTTLSGKDTVIQEFKNVYSKYEERKTIYCHLDNKKSLYPYGDEVKLANINDCNRIIEFLNSIDEFKEGNSDTTEKLQERIKNRTTRVYYIEDEEGRVVSSAQTSAENSVSAMLMSVATRGDKRGQGYITRCLSRLCNDIIDEGKNICLFYLNPKAGRIYHKLGFKNIGKWTLVIKK